EYMVENLSDDPRQEEIDALYERTLREAQEVKEDADDVPLEATRHMIIDALASAKEIKLKERVEALDYALVRCDELQLVGRVADPTAEMNGLRQGFILLMTAFDAAIFDLVGVALRRKFFSLVGAFGKQDKVSLQEIGNLGSLEALRDKIIEEQLKKRYIKD